MRSIVLSVIFPLVLVLLLSPSPVAGTSDWPTFHLDIQNTGATTTAGPDTNAVLWSYDLPGSPKIWSSPTAADGNVYVIGADSLYCFDASDGDDGPEWVSFVGDTTSSTPTAANGCVYVLSGKDDRRLYCFNASTGALKWRSLALGTRWNYFEDPSVEQWPESSPTVVGDSVVYVGSRDGYLYCINIPGMLHMGTAATTKWSTQLADSTGFVTSTPAYDGDSLVVVGACLGLLSDDTGGIFCLKADTGDTLWYYTYDGWREGTKSSPAIYDGHAYIGSDEQWWEGLNRYDGAVYKFNVAYSDMGNPPYLAQYDARFKVGCSVESTPAIYAGSLYIGTGKGLYCLSASNLSEIWHEWICEIWSSPAISAPISGDTLLYVTVGSTIQCLNAVNSDAVWSYDIGSAKKPSPAVAYGNVYIGDDDGTLYCFGESGRSELAQGVTPAARNARSLPGLDRSLHLNIVPNPSWSGARISCLIPGEMSGAPVRLDVFDVSGRLVTSLKEEERGAREACVFNWDGRSAVGREVPSGVYYMHMKVGRRQITKSVLLLR